MSAHWILLLALLSSFSRAGLNIIDRRQFGQKGLSVIGLNFLNTAIPAVLCLIIILIINDDYRVWLSDFFSWKAICFGGLIQLVSYAYSYAFRHLNVNQVTVAGKLSDLFIPFGIMLTIGSWNWSNYGFAIVTTLLCLPILAGIKGSKKNLFIGSWLFICLALTLQAAFSPLLAMQSEVSHAPASMFSFLLNVMLWRAVWTLIPAAANCRAWGSQCFSLLGNAFFLLRVILTFITQVSFIYAVSSPLSEIAWPIINLTGLIAMFLAIIFLHERPSKTELFSIISISIAIAVRFFTL